STLLNERGADSVSPRGWSGQGKLLVISQVTMSLMLLTGAGLFVHTLRNLKALELGFDRDHLLQVWTAPAQSGRTGPALAPLFQQEREHLSSLPGVLSVSASSRGLLNGIEGNTGGSEAVRVRGQEPRLGQRWGRAFITPGFFNTVGMPLLEGRDFTEA